MVNAYGRIFGTKKPVFDGRSNLYVRDPLPIGNEQVDLEVTLPGEGRDRVFRVAIKWIAQVSLYALEEALEGKKNYFWPWIKGQWYIFAGLFDGFQMQQFSRKISFTF